MAITSVVCNISMQSLVLRYGCAIGEFIDTPVHKGQRGVTMATNFGTKMAINAYKCISRRDNENAITYTGGFRGRPIQIRHFWLEGSKGRCHSNQILAKIGQKYITHKMAISRRYSAIFTGCGYRSVYGFAFVVWRTAVWTAQLRPTSPRASVG